MMIKKSNAVSKPVITATQMLESMLNNPRPTRAEAADVANAVFDGSDCVMLSGETAKGKYPIKAVTVMSHICQTAEAALDNNLDPAIPHVHGKHAERAEVIASAATRAARDLQAGAIIVISRSGFSARQLAKYKPKVPVVTLTPDPQTARQCLASYGLEPFIVDIEAGGATFRKAVAILKEKEWISGNVELVLVKGVNGVSGSTNSFFIGTVEELERAK